MPAFLRPCRHPSANLIFFFMLHSEGNSSRPSHAVFVTTHWSVVLAAGGAVQPGAREALEKLCHTYWYPLYAYVRRRGHDEEDAQDLTQEFLARLIAREGLADL